MTTPEQVRDLLIVTKRLIPAEQAAAKFNSTTGQALGDQVFLTIYLYPNSSTYILDPFATKITSRIEKYHFVEAWVDVNNLMILAARNEVKGIELVDIAEHSGNTESDTAVNVTPSVIPPVTAQATPLSDYLVFGALAFAGIAAGVLRRKDRNA
jgi:hypothetical protein